MHANGGTASTASPTPIAMRRKGSSATRQVPAGSPLPKLSSGLQLPTTPIHCTYAAYYVVAITLLRKTADRCCAVAT